MRADRETYRHTHIHRQTDATIAIPRTPLAGEVIMAVIVVSYSTKSQPM